LWPFKFSKNQLGETCINDLRVENFRLLNGKGQVAKCPMETGFIMILFGHLGVWLIEATRTLPGKGMRRNSAKFAGKKRGETPRRLNTGHTP